MIDCIQIRFKSPASHTQVAGVPTLTFSQALCIVSGSLWQGCLDNIQQGLDEICTEQHDNNCIAFRSFSDCEAPKQGRAFQLAARWRKPGSDIFAFNHPKELYFLRRHSVGI